MKFLKYATTRRHSVNSIRHNTKGDTWYLSMTFRGVRYTVRISSHRSQTYTPGRYALALLSTRLHRFPANVRSGLSGIEQRANRRAGEASQSSATA